MAHGVRVLGSGMGLLKMIKWKMQVIFINLQKSFFFFLLQSDDQAQEMVVKVCSDNYFC